MGLWKLWSRVGAKGKSVVSIYIIYRYIKYI